MRPLGSGPAGPSPALGPGALALEAGRFPRDKPCGDGLLPASVDVLHSAGVDLEAAGYPAIRGIRYEAPGGARVGG
jgi:hypothetical protein